ncbi:RNA polymerase sigma factor [Streptomyces aurantiacus]|uniref:RNA polymerase sigma factor n=1 Tax=Streptomyces aurantiacus TaxID=47760 RepID=UPI0012FEA0CF|nr:sigma-70 family RNA polymerase sigma factor [Streptomyces aurantiacus]
MATLLHAQRFGEKSSDVLSGNEDEFDSFFRKEYPRLVAHLKIHGLSEQASLDSAQDAMILAYRDWSEIWEPRTWVRKVAVRIAWRTNERDLRRHAREKKAHRKSNAAREMGPEEKLSDEEEWRKVLATLRLLPPAQRRVTAWLLDGYTCKEVAQHLHMPESTVRSTLRHARRRLAPLIERGLNREGEKE